MSALENRRSRYILHLVGGVSQSDNSKNAGWLSPDIFASAAYVKVSGWRVEGQPLAIRISTDTLGRLREHVALALNMPARCDISGVLIGRVETKNGLTIILEDYQVARHLTGVGDPSFHADERLEHLVRHIRPENGEGAIIGFFQSRQSAWPELTRADLRKARRLLPGQSNIFLTVRSSMEGTETAKFLLQETGSVKVKPHSGEFPLDADAIALGLALAFTSAKPNALGVQEDPLTFRSSHETEQSGLDKTQVPTWWNKIGHVLGKQASETRIGLKTLVGREWKAETAWAAGNPKGMPSLNPLADPAQAPSEVIQPFPALNKDEESETLTASDAALRNEVISPDQESSQGKSRRPSEAPSRYVVWRARLSVATTWLIAVSAAMWWTYGRPASLPHPSVEAVDSSISIPIGLEAHVDGKLLEIAWNRESEEAANVQNGFVTIRDGRLVTRVRLEPEEIRAGHIYYEPRDGDLAIRLEIRAENGESATESLRVLGAFRHGL
jgi:hypothetical protein